MTDYIIKKLNRVTEAKEQYQINLIDTDIYKTIMNTLNGMTSNL